MATSDILKVSHESSPGKSPFKSKCKENKSVGLSLGVTDELQTPEKHFEQSPNCARSSATKKMIGNVDGLTLIPGKSPGKSPFKNKSSEKCKKSVGFRVEQGEDPQTPGKHDGQSPSCARSPSTKRRRKEMDPVPVLDEVLEEEIERQWDSKAEKNNLTVLNVKNILKAVITNKYVVDMVRQTIEKGGVTDLPFEPKLTRSKTRELLQQNRDGPLPPVVGLLTPLKTPAPEINPEIKLLINEELPEDSSDEEYNPDNEVLEQSDEDDRGDTSVISDADSMPPTPASLQAPPTPSQELSQDGFFRVPQENVGQRTRSKLNLNRLPLETLEQMLQPPDVTEDMYEGTCDNPDWQQFLKEFQQPIKLNETLEDDVENDPEYNILEDEGKLKVDKEEMRKDRAVNISKKELNTLMKELFEFSDMGSSDDENVDQTVESIAALEESIIKETEDRQKREEQDKEKLEREALRKREEELMRRRRERKKGFVPSQMLLLKQQLQQHVQLTTQHFLQTYKHPKYHFYADTCKTMLTTLAGIKKDKLYSRPIENLDAAVATMNKWIEVNHNPETEEKVQKFVEDQIAFEKIQRRRKKSTFMKFPKELMETVLESEAFLYPPLLPKAPFRTTFKRAGPYTFIHSEEMLIALCLEQVTKLMEEKRHRFTSKKTIAKAKMIYDTCLPRSTPHHIARRVRDQRVSDKMNPIKALFENGEPPMIIHYVVPVKPGVKLWTLPAERLPEPWRSYVTIDYQPPWPVEVIISEEEPGSDKAIEETNVSSNLVSSNDTKTPDAEEPLVNKTATCKTLSTLSPQAEKTSNEKLTSEDQSSPKTPKLSRSKLENSESTTNKLNGSVDKNHSKCILKAQVGINKLDKIEEKSYSRKSPKKRVSFSSEFDSPAENLKENYEGTTEPESDCNCSTPTLTLGRNWNRNFSLSLKKKKKLSSPQVKFSMRCTPPKVKFSIKFGNSLVKNTSSTRCSVNRTNSVRALNSHLLGSFSESDSQHTDVGDKTEKSGEFYKLPRNESLVDGICQVPTLSIPHSPKPSLAVKLKKV